MMVEGINVSNYMVKIDEDAIVDLVASAGINRDNIEVDFDTTFDGISEVGLMIMYINKPTLQDTLDNVDALLRDEFLDNSNVWSIEFSETSDDNLPVITIQFTGLIYNENNYY